MTNKQTHKHILVVDDEERIRAVVQACLERLARWQVTTAASGTEALKLASSTSFDAILLDVSMPELDGLETFQRLQSHPQTQEIPVILLTAKVQPSEQAQYQKLGVAGLIIKPFDPMRLVTEITQLLGWLEGY
jgi:CheY-like chemotaxis protein